MTGSQDSQYLKRLGTMNRKYAKLMLCLATAAVGYLLGYLLDLL
jgi:hypothetical protein